jgi:hypothetical protein
MALSAPTQGGGSLFAAAPDGSALHCQYAFNSWSRSCVGVCQDNGGELFDLQINPKLRLLHRPDIALSGERTQSVPRAGQSRLFGN